MAKKTGNPFEFGISLTFLMSPCLPQQVEVEFASARHGSSLAAAANGSGKRSQKLGMKLGKELVSLQQKSMEKGFHRFKKNG